MDSRNSPAKSETFFLNDLCYLSRQLQSLAVWNRVNLVAVQYDTILWYGHWWSGLAEEIHVVVLLSADCMCTEQIFTVTTSTQTYSIFIFIAYHCDACGKSTFWRISASSCLVCVPVDCHFFSIWSAWPFAVLYLDLMVAISSSGISRAAASSDRSPLMQRQQAIILLSDNGSFSSSGGHWN